MISYHIKTQHKDFPHYNVFMDTIEALTIEEAISDFLMRLRVANLSDYKIIVEFMNEDKLEIKHYQFT